MLGWISSWGLKRYLSSIILAIAGVVSAIPDISFLTIWLQDTAAVVGAAGLTQASISKNLEVGPKELSCVFAVLIAVCNYVPALNPYVPILQAIAIALGGASAIKGTGSSPAK